MSRIGGRRKHAQAEPSAEYAHKLSVFVEIFLPGVVREPGPAR